MSDNASPPMTVEWLISILQRFQKDTPIFLHDSHGNLSNQLYVKVVADGLELRSWNDWEGRLYTAEEYAIQGWDAPTPEGVKESFKRAMDWINENIGLETPYARKEEDDKET